jgi:hypothetical protein
MATELQVSHLVGCSPRRTGSTSWTSWTSWGWRSVPAAARFTSESTARLRVGCETAAATAPPGAIRKHVRSGCAGPHWHARACEGSVGQLACRKFGDSTAATWRRCCLVREGFCLSHTHTHCHCHTLAPPLGLAPTHTPALLHSHRASTARSAKTAPSPSPRQSAICTLAHGRPWSLVATASPSMWDEPTLSVTLSPRPPSAPFLARPGQADGECPSLKTHRPFLGCRYSSVGCRALHAVA